MQKQRVPDRVLPQSNIFLSFFLIALRRELEEKKKREGKWQEPKMTPKQKEAFNIQLEKEAIIKNRLKALSDQLEPYLILFKHSLQGQPKAFAPIICRSKFLSTLHKVCMYIHFFFCG